MSKYVRDGELLSPMRFATILMNHFYDSEEIGKLAEAVQYKDTTYDIDLRLIEKDLELYKRLGRFVMHLHQMDLVEAIEWIESAANTIAKLLNGSIVLDGSEQAWIFNNMNIRTMRFEYHVDHKPSKGNGIELDVLSIKSIELVDITGRIESERD